MALAGGIGVNVARLADGSAAVHLVDYAYSADTDQVPVLPHVELTVRLPFDATAAAQISSSTGARIPLPLTAQNGVHTVTVPELSLYEVVTLSAGTQEPSSRDRDLEGPRT